MRFSPLGDRAVLITLGDSIDEATLGRVRAVCDRLDARPPAGLVELVPAYASVVAHYDPSRLPAAGEEAPHEWMVGELARLLAGVEATEAPPARVVEIPVCYGGELGPDLEEVARHAGLSAEEVASIHAGGEYRVHMIGFAPGFPYLGGLDERIAAPRLPTPRALVPASSVGIGGRQTGIYSIASPGGWRIVGRTPLRLFDPEAEPPALLRMGDRVRFRAITRAEYDAAGGAA